MKKLISGLAGAICFGLFATAAQAAPLSGTGSASSAAATTGIIQVHGLHSACKLDSRGWHRAYVWGRQKCSPKWHNHHHGKKHHHHHGKKHHHHGKKKHHH